MTTIEFRPTIGGVSQDPETDGGQVTRLVLYPDPVRAGSFVADVGPAVKMSPGVYAFTVPEPPPGRYYAAITWRPSADDEPLIDATAHVDFPLRADMVVSAEDVATAAGVPLPLDPATRENMWAAIQDAQDAVTGAIGPIFPETRTSTTLLPYGDDLTDPATWFDAPDRVTVVSATPNGDSYGTYTVVYRVGIDGATEGPILRYVRAHAAAYYAASPAGFSIPRQPTSVSAEGQSISYGSSGSTTLRRASTPGPDLAALTVRYTGRKPKVFQRRGQPLSRPGPTEAAWFVRAYDDGPFYYEG